MKRDRLFILLVPMLLGACALRPPEPEIPSPLVDYVRSGRSFALREIASNLSGITYDSDSDTHFLVQNGEANLYEYSADLRSLLRKIELVGGPSGDFEGIAYLGDGRIALANELNRVVIITIPADRSVRAVSVEPSDEDVQELVLPQQQERNKGLEGICYDPSGNAGAGTFFALQERTPRRIFRFDRPPGGADLDHADMSLRFDEPFDAEVVFAGLADDLSGCAFDPRTGRLLVLSHESSRIIDVSLSGVVVTWLNLPGRLRGGAPRYEGVSLGPDQALFLVSEPSIFPRASRAVIYEFTGESQAAAGARAEP